MSDSKSTDANVRYVWCGKHEPHGRHEWLKGARRFDCSGMNEHESTDAVGSYGKGRSFDDLAAIAAARRQHIFDLEKALRDAMAFVDRDAARDYELWEALLDDRP